MASGIFIVPILTMFGRIDIHTAIGASLVSVIACSCGSAAPFLKERLTNIRLAVLLETATTSGALCGVFLAGLIPTAYLYCIFALILLLSAQQMLSRRKESIVPPSSSSSPAPSSTRNPIPGGGAAAALRLDASYPETAGLEVRYSVQRLPLGMSLMYGAGLISALLGIGSGVLKDRKSVV